jgi:hypothetical protein
MPAVRTVAHEAAKKDYRFSELVLGIVKAPPFQMKLKAPVESIGQLASAQTAVGDR